MGRMGLFWIERGRRNPSVYPNSPFQLPPVIVPAVLEASHLLRVGSSKTNVLTERMCVESCPGSPAARYSRQPEPRRWV